MIELLVVMKAEPKRIIRIHGWKQYPEGVYLRIANHYYEIDFFEPVNQAAHLLFAKLRILGKWKPRSQSYM